MASKNEGQQDPAGVFVFGLKNTGKTSLLALLAGQDPPTDYSPTNDFKDYTIPFTFGKNSYNIKIREVPGNLLVDSRTTMTNFKSDIQIFCCSKSIYETVEYYEGPLKGIDTTSLPLAKYRLAFLTHTDEEDDNDAAAHAREVFAENSVKLVEVNLFTDKQTIVEEVTALLKRAETESPEIFAPWKAAGGGKPAKQQKGDDDGKKQKDGGKKGKCVLF